MRAIHGTMAASAGAAAMRGPFERDRRRAPIPSDLAAPTVQAASGSRIVIVGAGASGAILAARLMRQGPPDLEIVLLDGAPRMGRGLAYGTTDPRHILNVRAGNMSAFEDDPDHFVRWLAARRAETGGEPPTPFSFVARNVYGAYLESLLAPPPAPAARLVRVKGYAANIQPGPHGPIVTLDGGRSLSASTIVLATGHEARHGGTPCGRFDPWSPDRIAGAAGTRPVILLGTGLTMVDVALSLDRIGFETPAYALSRRGLLPRTHADAPVHRIAAGEVPFGRPASAVLAWLRRELRAAAARGIDWRSVVDGVRVHAQALWRSMAPDARRRFLRHARPYWDVHRHRMAPEVAEALAGLIDGGQLIVRAGRVLSEAQVGDICQLRVRSRGGGAVERYEVGAVVDCTGVPGNVAGTANVLTRNLLENGLARPDALDLGYDVSEQCEVIGGDGRPTAGLYAVGPASRAAFWEVTAIPDIRIQCEALARRLVAEIGRALPAA